MTAKRFLTDEDKNELSNGVNTANNNATEAIRIVRELSQNVGEGTMSEIAEFYDTDTSMSADELEVGVAIVPIGETVNQELFALFGGSFAYVMTMFDKVKDTATNRAQIALPYNGDFAKITSRFHNGTEWSKWDASFLGGKLAVQYGGWAVNDDTTEEDKAEAREGIKGLGLTASDIGAMPLKGSGYITAYPSKEGFYRVAGDPVFKNITPDSPYGLLIMFGAVYKLHMFISSKGTLYWGYTDNYTEPSEWHEAGDASEFLQLEGGTLTGDLVIEKSFPRLKLKNPKTGRSLAFLETDDYVEVVNKLDDTNSRGIRIKPETEVVEGSVYIDEYVNGLHKAYQLFGEHNLPSSQYTGNGSTTKITVELSSNGIGDLCYISGNEGFAFVQNWGAVVFNIPDKTTSYYGQQECRFAAGVLSIAVKDDVINKNRFIAKVYVIR